MVESYGGDGEYLTGVVTELQAGAGRASAPLPHAARVARRLPLRHHLALGSTAPRWWRRTTSRSAARMVRNDVVALLDGEGAEAIFNGLYVAEADQFVDNHMRVEHAGAALRQPRALQGHPRRARARRLQRPHLRAPGRAEDRRQADQPQPAAVAPRRWSTPTRSSRSSPTTSSARTARPSASSTTTRSSTCAPRHRRGGGARACSPTPSPARCRSAIDLEPRAPRPRGVPVRPAGRGRRRARRRYDARPRCSGRARRRARPAFDVAAVAPRLSRSSPSAATASRWSTSTAPPRAQKPRAVLDAIDDCYQRVLRQRAPRRALAVAAGDRRASRRRARRVAPLPQRAGRPTRWCSCAAPPRRSTWWRRAGAGRNVGPGDEVLITELEHHSNLVPWQVAVRGARRAAAGGADRRPRRGRARGARAAARRPHAHRGDRARLERASAPSTRCARSSRWRTRAGALVLVDGAQAAPHLPIDVQALGCDFYAFSGHKVFGPTGIGVLWGRRELLDAMPPYQGGGEHDPHRHLREDRVRRPVPHKFEAGTPDIAGAVGLAAALRLHRVARSRRRSAAHEAALLAEATRAARASSRTSASWAPRGTRPRWSRSSWTACTPHDLGTILDDEGIAVRAGHHCAQPVMERFGVAGHGARLVRALQHARRGRRSRRGARSRARGLRR